MYKKGIVFDNVGPLFEDPLKDLYWVNELDYIRSRHGIIDIGALNRAKDEIWVREFSVDPQMTHYQFWGKVFERIGISINDDCAYVLNNEIIDRHRPHNELLDYARGLKEAPQVLTELWTNVSHDWFHRFDERYALTSIFDHVTASGLEGKRKENPVVVKKMIDGLRESDCGSIAGVDDQQNKLDALKEYGIDPAILFESEEQTIEELNRYLGE